MKVAVLKGGAGSGNFDHAGRPGEVGGSAPNEEAGKSAITKSHYGDIANDLNSASIGKRSSPEARAWIRAHQNDYDSDRDFKNLVDAAIIYTQGGYKSVRVFAEYAITGKIPEDMQDSMYPDWAADNFSSRVLISPMGEIRDVFKNQTAGWKYTSANTAAATLQKAISDSAPLDISLFRGTYTKSDPPEVGQSFDIIGTSSFTADYDTAKQFSSGSARGQHGKSDQARKAKSHIIYEIVPGGHGLNVSPLSTWDQKEFITSGRFKVVDVKPYHTNMFAKYRGEVPGYHVKLEQTGVWDVDVDKFKKKFIKDAYE